VAVTLSYNFKEETFHHKQNSPTTERFILISQSSLEIATTSKFSLDNIYKLFSSSEDCKQVALGHDGRMAAC